MLRFDLGQIPVRVHFSFLFIAFFGPRRDLEGMAVWTVAVFLAVLAHEAGHAFTARAYGVGSISITLFALGGATMFPLDSKLTPGRRFVVSAAGSAVGIVLGGIVWLFWLNGAFDDATDIVRLAGLSFIWAALGWGVLNWIPIRPLDGGQMLTSALQIVSPERGPGIARVVSGVVGGAIVIAAFLYNQTFLAIFVAFITLVGLRGDPEIPTDEVSPRQAPSLQPGQATVDLDPTTVQDLTPPSSPDPEDRERPEPPAFPI